MICPCVDNSAIFVPKHSFRLSLITKREVKEQRLVQLMSKFSASGYVWVILIIMFWFGESLRIGPKVLLKSTGIKHIFATTLASLMLLPISDACHAIESSSLSRVDPTNELKRMANLAPKIDTQNGRSKLGAFMSLRLVVLSLPIKQTKLNFLSKKYNYSFDHSEESKSIFLFENVEAIDTKLTTLDNRLTQSTIALISITVLAFAANYKLMVDINKDMKIEAAEERKEIKIEAQIAKKESMEQMDRMEVATNLKFAVSLLCTFLVPVFEAYLKSKGQM